MSIGQISDADLHAYVDGELPPDRRAQVEAYLAAHPGASEHIRDLRMQTQILHELYDPVLNEPPPPELTEAVRGRRWLGGGLAAGVVWLVCGVIAGWAAHDIMAPPTGSERAFARNALAAHVLYTVEKRHPVEVSAQQEAHLVAWLSKRLDAPIHAPDLRQQGFNLLGGRLLPGEAGPLAQLMYESGTAERLTLTVKRTSQPGGDTGFRLMQQHGTSVFYWIERDYGYALSGNIERGRLLAIANAVERQLQMQTVPRGH